MTSSSSIILSKWNFSTQNFNHLRRFWLVLKSVPKKFNIFDFLKKSLSYDTLKCQYPCPDFFFRDSKILEFFGNISAPAIRGWLKILTLVLFSTQNHMKFWELREFSIFLDFKFENHHFCMIFGLTLKWM